MKFLKTFESFSVIFESAKEECDCMVDGKCTCCEEGKECNCGENCSCQECK